MTTPYGLRIVWEFLEHSHLFIAQLSYMDVREEEIIVLKIHTDLASRQSMNGTSMAVNGRRPCVLSLMNLDVAPNADAAVSTPFWGRYPVVLRKFGTIEYLLLIA